MEWPQQLAEATVPAGARTPTWRPLAQAGPKPDNPEHSAWKRDVMDRSATRVASLVESASRGDEQALATLMPLVYDELRRLAARHLRRERPGQTLQATALVHDVYIRLLQDSHLSWQNRAHFFGIAARSMRQILIERARSKKAAKRGGDPIRVTLDPGLIAAQAQSLDLEVLDDALTRLAKLDGELARVVELRFFGGLSIEEAAEALGISTATVKRRWTVAKAWLVRECGTEGAREA